MATQVAAQLVAKGPLSSALGQWMFLGFGTLVLFTGDNGVSVAAKEIASVAFRLVTGRDGASGAALFREAALSGQSASHHAGAQQQQPIVIHSVSSTNSQKGWTALVLQLGLGAGACWTAYVVFSNFLPDNIKEMLPVTRKFFESAVTSLGQGILRVRDALSEQIVKLGIKQDELAAKQDKTHDSVLGLKDDIGDVRLHIDDIAVAISRCENSLGDAAGRQTYMSSGVRLLVRCVGDLLRPSNPQVAEELDQFSRMSAELMDGEFDAARDNNSSSSPNKKHREQLEYPSSPNLSEIGSTTSTVVDDHHHQRSMRSFSLPRRSQSMATPSASNGAARAGRVSNVATPSPSSLLNMPPPPGALQMMHSFSGRGGGSVAAAKTVGSSAATSYSSPENEVPRSNSNDRLSSGQSTPSSGRDATDLAEVDELLRSMSSMRRGSSIQASG
eukprot:CAMPEP_0172541894 /NCGR_PEP_ID=MMETSP1067-20121228/12619_1 /TAXON_ID=265564 ORGANISM="Thalassiosira punctigera, Strain Tpunct2005C2" /NCGR_SAMPLE_ID=MMETSP1067 /ASSEMBLY_ACC=CAM_ASM_000444 /LENGTH=443 /DNA_ID=CAMNT_0013328021 /DNA_START=176 /DNA_END=1507 /DNA_ORIENTATION=-